MQQFVLLFLLYPVVVCFVVVVVIVVVVVVVEVAVVVVVVVVLLVARSFVFGIHPSGQSSLFGLGFRSFLPEPLSSVTHLTHLYSGLGSCVLAEFFAS